MAYADGFLGSGWKFPPEIDKSTGRFKTVEYEEDIKEAIYIIIMTRKGERIMMPDFGCGIHDYMFSQPDFTTMNLMKEEIREALIMWEPRIIDVDIDVELDYTESSKVNIEISYIVRATNNPFNLVYPFYINEGIGIA